MIVLGLFLVSCFVVGDCFHVTKMNSEVTVYDSELVPGVHLNIQGSKKLGHSNIEHIIFKNCSGVIDSPTFRRFSNLRKLTIWRSNIEQINTNLPLTNLISIGSHLPSLDYTLQTKLSKLETLFLIGNKNFEVDPHILKNFKHLKALHISEANFTDSCITKHWFKDMTQLEELGLSDNNINCITEDAFNPLKVLRKLDLTFNKVNLLDRKVFKKLSKLETLGFYGNILESFDINTLDSQRSHLEGLGINWALIRDVPAERVLRVLPKLKWISFGQIEMPGDFKAGVFCEILRQNGVNCIADSVFGVSKLLGFALKSN